MTCIAAWLEQSGESTTIHMGGDSAGIGGGWDLHLRRDPKVFRIKTHWAHGTFDPRPEELILGFTSSFRMGQLLRYHLRLPARDKPHCDPFEYMVTQFVPAARTCLKEGGYTLVESNREEGGFFLVGYAGRLFTVNDDFQVAEDQVPFAAVGCGSPFARGALHALWLSARQMAPEDRVLTALRVAESCCSGVRAPFELLSLP